MQPARGLPIRARLKTVMADAIEQQAAHGDVDHAVEDVDPAFVVPLT
jgi:hypothetical protein